MRFTLALVALSLGLSWTPVATADIPGPPGYIETCTVEKKQQTGTTCVTCAGSHDDDDTADGNETCTEKYAGTDYEYVCQTSGASFWTEVWCDGPPKEGCSIAPAGRVSIAALVGLGFLALLAVGVIRRRA